ncbi:antirestriction protein [Trueperella pyogenes]|nr:antirestriction protein [Trueperella pyogenes]
MGCLACYNAGRLVGDWFDAEAADEVTPEDLHDHPTSHEELWVFDLEGFPRGAGEMSPSAAALWGELCEEVGEMRWDALLAWVETGCYVADSDDLPCVSDFEERFCGCWNSESDYSAHLADELGIWDEIPEHLHSYFDLDAWWRDERLDYAVADAPGGGVFIFRSH